MLRLRGHARGRQGVRGEAHAELAGALTLVDHERGKAYYLAFDLLLVEAPMADGRPDLAQGRVARSEDPAEGSRLAMIRATLLGGGEMQAEVDAERARAQLLAEEAGLAAPPEPPRPAA